MTEGYPAGEANSGGRAGMIAITICSAEAAISVRLASRDVVDSKVISVKRCYLLVHLDSGESPL